MTQVQTVLGPRSAEALGPVLMHEHLLFDLPGWDQSPLIDWKRETSAARLAKIIAAANAVGLGTIVDLTAIGVGRDIPFLREVAERSGVPIVACTGWWLDPGITAYFASLTVEELAAIMTHELTMGIGATGVRAGIIKAATSENVIHPSEEKVLRAAARAQLETGSCISTHTSRGSLGLEQIAVLATEGATLERVVIGHSDDCPDLDYHRRLLDRGVTVQFDHIGTDRGITDIEKAGMLATLIAEGHAAQLTLSQDTVGERPDKPHLMTEPNYQRSLSHLFTSFLPLLRERDVSEAAIQTMIVANPARLLPF